ncbi:Detected protein of confused Function [Hibiscus syriacus]|uniref:Detected protein of confused Function n=1 Tax=Hibiscus syriacus TaxID=106335 RepID=A0A6A2ZYJ6_HIBSY|nr:Detected protein of confused Function [Hibiscus syriacus]
MMETEEISKYEALPLLSLNHVSLLCRSVWDSMRFYEQILGFVPIKRPSSFNFNGAWLYNYGIGIHLIENPSIHDFDAIVEPRPINPKDNHISFQCRDVGLVMRRLEDMGMKYVTAVVEDEGNRVIKCSSMTRTDTWSSSATVRTSQSFHYLPAHSSRGSAVSTGLHWLNVDSWKMP